jgi:hypothetical protein
MSLNIPSDPAVFFTEFFPRRFELDRKRYPSDDTVAAALFEVTGVGSWSIRIRNGKLDVMSGKSDDTAIQIALSHADFTAVFVERTLREIREKGDLSDHSRDAFKPLFVGAKKQHLTSGMRETLVMRLDQEGVHRRLVITPGAGAPTEPRVTVTVALNDFLAMQSGTKNPTLLFMRGQLKIKGDVGYALKANALLS